MMNFMTHFQKSLTSLKELSQFLKQNDIHCNLYELACEVSIGKDYILNISFPIDAGGRFETILKQNDSIIYINELGYDDVQRFQTHEDVLEEIHYLKDCINNYNDDKYDDDDDEGGDIIILQPK